MKTTESLEEAAGLALERIKKLLAKGSMTTEGLKELQGLIPLVSAWTRNRATDGGLLAANYMMARELATNRDELERYVALTSPTSPLLKQLPSGKAGRA